MTEDNFETVRFDEAIRNKMAEHHVQPGDAAWNRLNSRLQTEMPRRLTVSRNTQIVRYAVAATLIAATLTFSLWKAFSSFEKNQAPVANKEYQPTVPQPTDDATSTTEAATQELNSSSVKQVIEPSPGATQQASVQPEKSGSAIPSLQENPDVNSVANENYTPSNSSGIQQDVPAIPIKILREEPKQPLDNIEVIEKKVDSKKRKTKK